MLQVLNMTDVRNYPKQFLTEFIELYRSLPSIWKLKSKDYTDRNKKMEAYQKMAEKLKEVEPNADRDMVRKKINSLRSSYRKEKRKVRKSIREKGYQVHVPKLWYYDLFNFLDGQGSSCLSLPKTEKVELQDDEDFDSDDNSFLEPPSPSDSNSETDPLNNTHSLPVDNHLKRKMDNEEMATPALKRTCDNSEDEHDIFGRYVAVRLRNLPKTQRIYLEKIINDAIFEAELGNLSRGSFHISEEYNNK